ncbi:hypothetical protein C8R43DRAFT_1191635 [Mycena crocata]|nr:hypothetical protein C8R43DRAFT_1191635 [Mycena crocata]
MEHNTHHTRSATRGGIRPAPPPLYSPQALAFGSIESGAMAVPSIEASMRPTAAKLAARPSLASGDGKSQRLARWRTGLFGVASSYDERGGHRRQWRAMMGAGLPSLARLRVLIVSAGSNGSNNTHNNYASDLSSSDSENESTFAKASNELSAHDLEALARRYDAMAAQFRVQLAQKAVPKVSQEKTNSNGLGNAPNVGAHTPDISIGSIAEPEPVPAVVSKSHRATVEEIDDEDDLIQLNRAPGPSRDKGKGADPRNWGNVSSFLNFSDAEMKAQLEMLQNFEEINRVIKQEGSLHTGNLVDFSPLKTSSPKLKASRKRSKSPKFKKSRMAVEKPPVVELATQASAPDVEMAPKPAPTVEIPTVKPMESNDFTPASASEAAIDSDAKSGPSLQEMLAMMNERIIELQVEQRLMRSDARPLKEALKPERAPKEPRELKSRTVPPLTETVTPPLLPRGTTPGRMAAENFFEKALRDTPIEGTSPDTPPSDSSDDSSSDSGESSNRSNAVNLDTRGVERQALGYRLSASGAISAKSECS